MKLTEKFRLRRELIIELGMSADGWSALTPNPRKTPPLVRTWNGFDSEEERKSYIEYLQENSDELPF